MPTTTSGSRGPITRADVARFAGVSVAVVSYVVNGGPGNVAPATRERVLDAIRVLDYHPNANARALTTGSSRLLGLVLTNLDNPLYAEFALGIETAAAGRGYALLLANSGGDPAVELQQLAALSSRQVDGILLSTSLPDTHFTHSTSGTNTVLLDAFHVTPGVSSVGVDAFEGARVGTQHLIEHGHRSIALIIGRSGAADIDDRERGWAQAGRDAGLPDGPIARESFDRHGGYRAARRLFSAATRPSAVFVSSDMQAIGALAALHELGLRVPEDVAVVSFDGTDETRFTIPALTVVRQPVTEMAEKLVDLVLNPSVTAENSRHRPELIIRVSCGCDNSSDRLSDTA